MAAVSPNEETINLSRHIDTPSSSELATDVAPVASSSADIPSTSDSPGRDDNSNSSLNPSRDDENQQLAALRSEEYRQLFRLPSDEVLVQDFNCAFQESILLQGHMYLFVHYICFYSNIFGFETKKIIPFHEISSVKRAKTAGIFPNAIEIFAGGKKYFFASFLSRDEAFKIINDGWLQHGNGLLENSDLQDSLSETSSHENTNIMIEKVNGSKHPVNDLDSSKRNMDVDLSNDSEVSFNVAKDELREVTEAQNGNSEQDVQTVINADSSCSSENWSWKIENSDVPKVPEGFTKVAETKFLLTVEEFFRLFFSDDAVSFIDSFHRKCGDKEFRCTSWRPHDEFGHCRDVSFQHPIKIYLGAKFGSCQEVQKFRVYRNSHLVIETSQEISDVPYGDYFRVEGLWDVQRDDNGVEEGCILKVYVNVAFIKRTVFKGKIIQSTVEECKEAYAAWMSMAHDLLKQKNLEKQEERVVPASTVQNDAVPVQREVKTQEPSNRSEDTDDQIRMSRTSDSMETNQQVAKLLQGSLNSVTSIASLSRELATKFWSLLKSQSRVSLVLVVSFVVIFLMQVTILVLLNRPQHIHVASPPDYMGVTGVGLRERSEESLVWLDKRMHYLKDEMLMVESRLERMWHEHTVLKAQLKDLEKLRKRR